MDEPRIVAGVASMVSTGSLGVDHRTAQIEAAMIQAVEDCLKEGISIEDGEKILARKAEYLARLQESW